MNYIADHITLSSQAAEGLELALDQDFGRVESPERMAWIVLLLKLLPEKPEWFPRGKWGTIQHIEGQLALCAEANVLEMIGENHENPGD